MLKSIYNWNSHFWMGGLKIMIDVSLIFNSLQQIVVQTNAWFHPNSISMNWTCHKSLHMDKNDHLPLWSHLLLDFNGITMYLATTSIFSPHFVQTWMCLQLWSHHCWILLRSHWTLPFHSISSCIHMHIYLEHVPIY